MIARRPESEAQRSRYPPRSATGRGTGEDGADNDAGGNGGAIYNDGNTMHLRLCGTRIENNHANAFGSAIFFVSNDHSGDVSIEKSIIRNNPNDSGWERHPGISAHDDTPIDVDDTTVIE